MLHLQRIIKEFYGKIKSEIKKGMILWQLKLQKKSLEENIKVNLCNTGLGNGFLGMTPKSTSNKKKKDINYIILNKKFHAIKNIRVERHPQNGRIICK